MSRSSIVTGDLFTPVEGDQGGFVAVVTCPKAAESLQVSQKRVARAIDRGILRGGKFGREWWVDAGHLKRVLESGGWHSLDIRPGPRGPKKAGRPRRGRQRA